MFALGSCCWWHQARAPHQSSCLWQAQRQVRLLAAAATWSQVAREVKNLLAMQEMQEMWVPSLGRKDPLEKEMATHCSIFAWEIPWTEEPVGLQSMGSQRVRHDLATEHTCKLLDPDSNFGSRVSEWKSLRRVQLLATPWTVCGIL